MYTYLYVNNLKKRISTLDTIYFIEEGRLSLHQTTESIFEYNLLDVFNENTINIRSNLNVKYSYTSGLFFLRGGGVKS